MGPLPVLVFAPMPQPSAGSWPALFTVWFLHHGPASGRVMDGPGSCSRKFFGTHGQPIGRCIDGAVHCYSNFCFFAPSTPTSPRHRPLRLRFHPSRHRVPQCLSALSTCRTHSFDALLNFRSSFEIKPGTHLLHRLPRLTLHHRPLDSVDHPTI